MERRTFFLNVSQSIIVFRGLTWLLLAAYWLGDSGEEIGAVLLVILLLGVVARWRFTLPAWTVLMEQLACAMVAIFWPGALLGLTLPLFETVRLGQPWFFLPGLISLVLLPFPVAYGVLLLATSMGALMVRSWSLESQYYRREADQQRRDRYELERLKTDLLQATIETTRLAELAERHRLAQELHDDIGHELTGAVLALQAFEPLWQENDPLAAQMLVQAQTRLQSSAKKLRQTAHNIHPLDPVGLERLEEICTGFQTCPLFFRAYGDDRLVPSFLWHLLEVCLKEGLTNAIRHAQPSQVFVELDINPHILRLSIENDGVVETQTGSGLGLRHLRQRVKAVGGSISTDVADRYRLVCVLPLPDAEEHENDTSLRTKGSTGEGGV